MTQKFIKERERQISLLKKCKETSSRKEIKKILTDYPKLFNGIDNGLIDIDQMIKYLENHLETYKNAGGEHKIKQIRADGEFSIKLFKDRGFYEKRGITPPDKKTIDTNIVKLINDYKIQQAAGPDAIQSKQLK